MLVFDFQNPSFTETMLTYPDFPFPLEALHTTPQETTITLGGSVAGSTSYATGTITRAGLPQSIVTS